MNEDQQLEHLKLGYDNIQQVLRFLDAKAGSAFVVAGGFLSLLEKDGCSSLVIGVLLVFSMIAALQVILPRKAPRRVGQLSLLFPVFHPDSQSSAKIRIHDRMRDLDMKRARCDFEEQYLHLSGAVFRKTKWMRLSIFMLVTALVWFLLSKLF